MRPLGLIVAAACLLFPLNYFVPLAGEHDSSAILSQYLGSVALIAMGICQKLATRLPGLEAVFGGLDRIYKLHK